MRTLLALLTAAIFISGVVGSTLIAPIIPTDIVRALLSDKPLIDMLHVDLPERQPLFIVRTLAIVAHEHELSLPYDIEFVEPKSKHSNEAFDFIGYEDIRPDRARVTFVYPPEGLEGSYLMRKHSEGWEVLERNLIEQ